VIDSPSPFIAAHHAVGRTVYTRNPSTNSYVSASLDPISPPATDVAVITSSDPGNEPSTPSPPPVPATLEPTTPPSASAAHEPTDASRHPLSPLLPSASTCILYLLRPSRLMRRSPVWRRKLQRTVPSGSVPHYTSRGRLVAYRGLKL